MIFSRYLGVNGTLSTEAMISSTSHERFLEQKKVIFSSSRIELATTSTKSAGVIIILHCYF